MTALLQLGAARLASGRETVFKIDCDVLTAADWLCAGRMLAQLVKPYHRVLGVPTGGLSLATALEVWAVDDPAAGLLVADDVWTTGGSWSQFARAMRKPGEKVQGAVVFARGRTADYVTPLFTLDERLWAS